MEQVLVVAVCGCSLVKTEVAALCGRLTSLFAGSATLSRGDRPREADSAAETDVGVVCRR